LLTVGFLIRAPLGLLTDALPMAGTIGRIGVVTIACVV
jgi:hypothetical protein